MKSDKMFKAYDCRGKYGEEVTEENAYFTGVALKKFAKRIVVAMDYREHNLELAQAFAAGYAGDDKIEFIGHALTAAGVYNCGKDSSAIFTASHNPVGYNGIKLLKDKRDYSGDELSAVKKAFNESRGQYVGQKSEMEEIPELLEKYSEALPECKGGVYDLCGGAVCTISKNFDNAFFTEPDPRFVKHAPEPTDQTLGFLKQETLKQGKVGFAFDGDGDRVAVVDKGVTLNASALGAFYAMNYCKKGDSIVFTLDNSQEVVDYLNDNGFKTFYSKVGHVFVEDIALKQNAVLAVEASQHFSIMKHMAYADAAFFALTLSDSRPGEILEFSKQFKNESTLEKVNGRADFKKIKELAEENATSINDSDGVKAQYEDYTILMRPSNTEPIIRVFSEAKTREKMLEGLKKAKELIEKARIA